MFMLTNVSPIMTVSFWCHEGVVLCHEIHMKMKNVEVSHGSGLYKAQQRC